MKRLVLAVLGPAVVVSCGGQVRGSATGSAGDAGGAADVAVDRWTAPPDAAPEATPVDDGAADAPQDVGPPRDAPADGPALPCVTAHRIIPTKNADVQGIMTDATHLYWFDDASGASLYQTDKCSSGPTQLLATSPYAAQGLAQDATTIYVATSSNTTTSTASALLAVSKATGAVTPIVPLPMGSSAVAAASGWVYWTERATSRVARARPDGSGVQTLPLAVTAPRRVTVLDDGTVCALGADLECELPTSAVVTATIPRANASFLSTDGGALYLLSSDTSGAWLVLRATVGATIAWQVISADPGDAGGLPLSSVLGLPGGAYVVYGEGTARWIPAGGGPFLERQIAQTLPPLRFWADTDGMYWEAGNGLEVGPPIGP